MKKIIALLILLPALALAQNYPSPTYNNLTVNGSFTATGLVTTGDLATQAANTVLANRTGGIASPTALAVPSCSTTTSALQWTSGTGLTCFAGSAPLASPTFTGTVTLPATSQTASGQFFGNLGAHMDNLNDRVFLGAVTPYNGNSNVQPPDWTGSSFLNGGVPAFGYLEQNGTLNVSAIKGQLGIVAAARASDGTGGGTQATIGVSSVVSNDNATGAGAGTWAYYGTTVRTAAATGLSTLAQETDVANLGTKVQIFPSAMFPTGLTANLWVAAGGELPNQAGAGYTFNNTSAAIAILANNAASYANVAYDKGIVFAANALSSNNTAIAFAPSQAMQWFNSSNQVTGAFTSSATTTATGQQITMGPNGTLVQDMGGLIQFRVNNATASAANYVQVAAAAAGTGPFISAVGTDANINLILQGQGTGTPSMPQNDVLNYTSTGGQSIPNNTPTTLTTWTKVFDRVNANFNASTGVFTAPVAGFYHVEAGISYASGTATATNQDYQVAVIGNGVTECVGAVSSQEITSSTVHGATTGCDVSLAVSQTITIQAFQNSGAANTLNTGAGTTYVSIHRIP